MPRSSLGLPLVLTLFAALPGRAADKPPTPQQLRFFETRVRPVLAANCFRCHGPDVQKSGLRLDSRAEILEGGDQGPAIVPGRPEKSLLLRAVRQVDASLKMPPNKKKLSARQIADLTLWVKMGAPWPAAEKKKPTKAAPHWAFQKVRRPPVPPVKDCAWPANPIDAFLLARLEAKGLRPNPPATRYELLRRATYDLTGLPPTPREVKAFLADASPRAYEGLIDRLLASPRYGEKWGRHWLDLVRFAETNSYERDGRKPSAWRYRDYVIGAFNSDKPYDRFIREQLAGDELPGRDLEALTATGYYRLGIWDDEPADRLQRRYDELDDIVATTGQVFLGLTLDCARCHNHKREPIPQKDYYRILAFFQNINEYRNGGPTDEVPLSGKGWMPPRKGKPRKTILCVTEPGRSAPKTFLLKRGNPHVPGEQVEPGFPKVFNLPDPAIPTPAPDAKTCGRRSVLARWIASADNPLTARVLVNRLWQHHFGRGIVRSPNDFGTKGDAPTHPRLLDWLATEFVRHGWHLKPLHRLIMTSRAYRMSSRGHQAGLKADPANDLFWRFDMRRLTAEEIRDSILAVNGTLYPRMYGPGIFPEIPAEVLAGQSMPGAGWGKSPPHEQARRSVYIHVKRSLLAPIVADFDAPETDRTTPVRFATTQPTQALVMLNGKFVNRQAALLAGRLRREAGPDVGKQVRRALWLATSRPPTAPEISRGVKLIERLQKADGLSADGALKAFCLLVFNLNEFIYLD
jgi:cytochrome c553